MGMKDPGLRSAPALMCRKGNINIQDVNMHQDRNDESTDAQELQTQGSIFKHEIGRQTVFTLQLRWRT